MTVYLNLCCGKKLVSAVLLYSHHTNTNAGDKEDYKKLVAISSFYCSVTNTDMPVMRYSSVESDLPTAPDWQFHRRVVHLMQDGTCVASCLLFTEQICTSRPVTVALTHTGTLAVSSFALQSRSQARSAGSLLANSRILLLCSNCLSSVP
jgi:hypothetical protein